MAERKSKRGQVASKSDASVVFRGELKRRLA